MKTSTPVIRKVKFKSGGDLTILPDLKDSIYHVQLEWADVTIRYYDDKETPNAAKNHYTLLAAADSIMYGE